MDVFFGGGGGEAYNPASQKLVIVYLKLERRICDPPPILTSCKPNKSLLGPILWHLAYLLTRKRLKTDQSYDSSPQPILSVASMCDTFASICEPVFHLE